MLFGMSSLNPIPNEIKGFLNDLLQVYIKLILIFGFVHFSTKLCEFLLENYFKVNYSGEDYVKMLSA